MVKRVALVFGVVFLIIGIAGYLTEGGMQMGADPAPALLFGLFPVNLLHNAVHVAFGLWGLLASRSLAGSRNYTRIGGVAYLVLVIVALIDPTAFGFVPIGGNNIWLHALLAVGLLFFGFVAREDAPAADVRAPDRP